MQDPRLVRLSRILVLVWGVLLCLTAQLASLASGKFPQILDLALSMAGYTGGALLAGFMLAFLRIRIDARGFMWSAPLSVLTVFAIAWHQPWAHWVCWAGAVILLGTWLLSWRADAQTATAESPRDRPVLPAPVQFALLIAGLSLMLAISYFGYFGKTVDAVTGKTTYTTLAWPWFIAVGSTIAFVFGWLLARKKPTTETWTGRSSA